MHEGRPVVVVTGGFSADGDNGRDKTEMLDYTQTNSAWVEGKKIQICLIDLTKTLERS